MLKVENAKISIDQKLNHAWNCSNIKVTNNVSILQLKPRVDTQNEDTKVISKVKENEVSHCRICITSKTEFHKYENYF